MLFQQVDLNILIRHELTYPQVWGAPLLVVAISFTGQWEIRVFHYFLGKLVSYKVKCKAKHRKKRLISTLQCQLGKLRTFSNVSFHTVLRSTALFFRLMLTLHILRCYAISLSIGITSSLEARLGPQRQAVYMQCRRATQGRGGSGGRLLIHDSVHPPQIPYCHLPSTSFCYSPATVKALSSLLPNIYLTQCIVFRRMTRYSDECNKPFDQALH